jgi:hypothetical protein
MKQWSHDQYCYGYVPIKAFEKPVSVKEETEQPGAKDYV